MSDFSPIENAGHQCVGCGRGSESVLLKRLNTYARSLACFRCYFQHKACANENPEGKKCRHDPTEHVRGGGACEQAGCGCPGWRHGLENDLDRMYAACVGIDPRSKECGGYGQVECHTAIYPGPDGTIERLCPSCMRGWVNAVKEGQREAEALLNIKTDVELPN